MKHNLVVISNRNEIYSNNKSNLIARAISTPAGRMALAQAMANPIRTNLDYMGIARKCFLIEEIPKGTELTYKDIKFIHNAVVIRNNRIGRRDAIISGLRVTAPQFEIVSCPTINISEVKKRRFNIID